VGYRQHSTIMSDVKMGSCLDPGKNRTGLEGGGTAGPGPPERGKDRQLKPSRDGAT
jgi:hypothetical protein